MYNEQLENLIDAALADGVLTEKEKQILFKKAQTMGVDLDEFEMVLDARLVKLQKAEQEKVASSAPKSNKLGDVKKCPACGAMVQSYQGVCPECGYAFENIEANSSAQKLSDIIAKIKQETKEQELQLRMKRMESNSGKEGFFTGSVNVSDSEAIDQAIKNFPIPNTKSDLFEFITSLQTKTEGVNGHAYEAKLNECIEKAKLLFSDDEMFRKLIDNAEANQKKKKKRSLIITFGVIFGFVAFFALFFLLDGGGSREHIVPNKCLKKVQAAIEKGNYEKAEKLIIEFTGGRDSWNGSKYTAGDCHESVVALERALLKEGRVEEAEEIYDIYVDKVKGSSREDEYIEKVAGPIERYKSK